MFEITWENWVDVVKNSPWGFPGALVPQAGRGEEVEIPWFLPITDWLRDRFPQRQRQSANITLKQLPRAHPFSVRLNCSWCGPGAARGGEQWAPEQETKTLFHQLAPQPWEIEERRRSRQSSKDHWSVKETKNGRKNRWFPGWGCLQL